MLEYALKQAFNMPHQRHKIYAVITDHKGRIVGEAGNSYKKTHPFQKRYADMLAETCDRTKHKIYLHAEIAAIIKAKGKGHTIYVARAGNKGKPLLAKPCPMCQIAIEDAGITEIFYTE